MAGVSAPKVYSDDLGRPSVMATTCDAPCTSASDAFRIRRPSANAAAMLVAASDVSRTNLMPAIRASTAPLLPLAASLKPNSKRAVPEKVMAPMLRSMWSTSSDKPLTTARAKSLLYLNPPRAPPSSPLMTESEESIKNMRLHLRGHAHFAPGGFRGVVLVELDVLVSVLVLVAVELNVVLEDEVVAVLTLVVEAVEDVVAVLMLVVEAVEVDVSVLAVVLVKPDVLVSVFVLVAVELDVALEDEEVVVVLTLVVEVVEDVVAVLAVVLVKLDVLASVRVLVLVAVEVLVSVLEVLMVEVVVVVDDELLVTVEVVETELTLVLVEVDELVNVLVVVLDEVDVVVRVLVLVPVDDAAVVDVDVVVRHVHLARRLNTENLLCHGCALAKEATSCAAANSMHPCDF